MRLKSRTIDEKMDEMISLLTDRGFDEGKRKELQERFTLAMRTMDAEKSLGGEWLETEMDIILSRRNTRKYPVRRNLPGKNISKIIRIIIGVLFIALGFGMIILPTPSSFEIYTLYYFNTNDGFTVMDLISLIIVFCGIYLLITVNRSRH